MNKADHKIAGFTIVELMIATVVFSIVLLVCMASLIQIGRMFYKGITLTRANEVMRSSIEDITGDLKITGAPTIIHDGSITKVCTLHHGYYFEQGKMYDGTPGSIGLIRQDDISTTGCQNASLTNSTASQLLDLNMRISDLDFNCSIASHICDVTAYIAYGDDELLGGTSAATGTAPTCISDLSSSQFCATAQLKTSVAF